MAKKRKYPAKFDCDRREFVKTSAQSLLAASVAGAALQGCAQLAARAPASPRSGDDFEYVVVGSGAGGGPVACNLARAGYRVLLIEAGTDYRTRNYDVPAFHPQSTEEAGMAWSFYVKHYSNPTRQAMDSKFTASRGGVLYPRAGTLGGCTAHNALLTLYPDNADWDGIADITGDRSWASGEMRRYFQRMERNQYVKRPLLSDPSRHGYEGWLSTEQTDPALLLKDPKLVRIALAAIVQEGLDAEIFKNLKLDPNDWRYIQKKANGIFNIPKSTSHGHRNGTREFILRTQAEFPSRLVVRTGCLVTRVLFDDVDRIRAVGVEYVEGEAQYRADPRVSDGPPPPLGERKRALARREVILAGGAFNSPQLLQLSGVGDPSVLRAIGVDSRVDLPGVGLNLQDRYEVGVVSELDGDLPTLRDHLFGMAGDPALPKFDADPASSLYSSNGTIVAVFRKSGRRVGDPDLCIFGLAGNFRGYYPGYSRDVVQRNRVTWAILKGHTRNTAGYVRATSADPREMPEICFRYFDEGNDASGQDLEDVLEGIHWVRGMNRKLGLVSDVIRREVTPGPGVASDDQLRQFIRNEAWGHHASCTNRMGRADDAMSVVDSKFRVRGTRNLRVVDASVFPKIPGLFIVVPIYMVAEKASEDIVAAAADARRL